MSVTSCPGRRDGGGDGGAAHQTRGNAVRPYLVAINNSYTIRRQQELEQVQKRRAGAGCEWEPTYRVSLSAMVRELLGRLDEEC